MVGIRQYSTSEGYSTSFKYRGPCPGSDLFDVIFLDASVYPDQSSKSVYLRDLNKAYCGFVDENKKRVPISTGNWGCGAFGGNKKQVPSPQASVSRFWLLGCLLAPVLHSNQIFPLFDLLGLTLD